MIEAYAFLAMFPVQILAMSVVYPAWFIRYSRRQAASIPAERLAQLYPGIDLALARESFLTRYRTLNAVIVVAGLVLFGWLFAYLRRPDWKDGPVQVLVAVYFIAQSLVPLAFLLWHGIRFDRAHKHPSPERKRKATLEPRGLFDFVSPFVVFAAGSSYLLFAAFVVYLFQQQPPRGLLGLIMLISITLVYALNAFVVYAALYGKKPNPFAQPADRVHTIGLIVKSSIFSCIACVVFLSLTLLDLQKWAPFALSAFFVITALISLMGMTPRKPGSTDLDSEVAPHLRGT